MGKTLKIYSFKGVNVYIRFLSGMWYEFLVSYRGGIYAHQLQLMKPHGDERRNKLEERHEGAIRELSLAANSLISALIEERSLKNQIIKLFNGFKKQITAQVRRFTQPRSEVSGEGKQSEQGSDAAPGIVHESEQ